MKSTNKNVKVFAANSHPALAEEIALLLGQPLGQRTLKKFSCGEIYVNFDESIRGHEIFLVATCRPNHVHEDFFELFLMCDAARRSFARNIHVIVPHFGYARQDKLHAARESISMKLCADLLVQSGIDHLVTLNLHADQSQAFFDVPVDNVSARKLLLDHFQKQDLADTIVVSPDVGGAKTAKKFADALGLDLAILHKNRPKHNEVEMSHVIGEVKGKRAILVDDMIDTAGSVCNAKEILISHGASDQVSLCATHPIFSGPAIERLEKAGFAEIVVTNSIPIPEDKLLKNLTQISIAPLMANVILNVVREKSVSELFY